MLLNTKSIWLRNYTWRDKDKRTFKSGRIIDFFEMSRFGTNFLNLAGDRFLTWKKKQFPSSHSLFDDNFLSWVEIIEFCYYSLRTEAFPIEFLRES